MTKSNIFDRNAIKLYTSFLKYGALMWLAIPAAIAILFIAGLFSPDQKEQRQWQDSLKVTVVDSNNVVIKQYIVYRK